MPLLCKKILLWQNVQNKIFKHALSDIEQLSLSYKSKKVNSLASSSTIKGIISVVVVILLVTLYYFSLCFPLFTTTYSTVLEDKDGYLLGAAIAPDGQWRFPPGDSLSDKYTQAVIHFEDEHFARHPGVNPAALARAAWQNWQAGRVVSGGSTLTMQTIRLSRGEKRTLWEKCIEMMLATRLEWALSKEEILRLYAAHAPFGGNVVGIDAAAWRYFGVSPHQLSWAENALLAVLPNSPSLLYPGRNNQQLLDKRNRLLRKLWQHEVMDSLTYVLATTEPLPDRPQPLPTLAPRLLTRLINEGHQGQRIVSTIDLSLQQRANAMVRQHYQKLQGNGIHNAAALIVEVETGEARAYVGNTNAPAQHHSSVDIITARRSTGSLLKPFLYAAMLDEGFMLPQALVPDVPTFIDGFMPQNFNKQFEGAVPADQVIARSLNVPSVHMLRDYGIEKFHHQLQRLGMTTLDQAPGHYGLSLIIGGAEGSLWDVTGMYASAARTLNHYFKYPEPYRYAPADVHPLVYQRSPDSNTEPARMANGVINAGAWWFTFKAMLEVVRPDAEAGWQYYASAKKVAWKTGTSHGHRDAWAIGVTPQYVIGVWVGNADGEGRPDLTGVTAAAPLLFDLISLMPTTDWFDTPRSDLAEVLVSRHSGYRAPVSATDTVRVAIPRAGLRSPVSPYHPWVHLDSSGQYQVHADCETARHRRSERRFVLPPVQAWYYQSQHPEYQSLPPLRADCRTDNIAARALDVIYPRAHATIYIPRELDGVVGRTVLEAAHRNARVSLFWHIDDQYVGRTRYHHQMALTIPPGQHVLTLIDEEGETIRRPFTVLQSTH